MLALNWQVGRGGSGSVSGTRPEVLVLLVLVVVVAILGKAEVRPGPISSHTAANYENKSNFLSEMMQF